MESYLGRVAAICVGALFAVVACGDGGGGSDPGRGSTSTSTSSSSASSSSGAAGCAPGEASCNGRCVDLGSDNASCGACGQACAGVCSGGVCTPGAVSCTAIDGCASGLGCTNAGDSQCGTCVAGRFRVDGAADACAACSGACGAGSFESSACAVDHDRVCQACATISNCAEASCTKAADAVCNACNAGTFWNGVACAPCTKCTGGTFETKACSTGSNRKCSSCDPGMFWDGTACLPCRSCAPGQRESTACTTEHDRACTSCTVIQDCAVETCSTATDQVCRQCATGTHLSGNACVACSACATGTYEAAACTASEDRVCLACNAVPFCAATICSSSTDQVCTACVPGFVLSGGRCVSPLATLSAGASVVLYTSRVTASLRVANTSVTETAIGVRAALPGTFSDVVQDASDCAAIPPGGSCLLRFNTTTNRRRSAVSMSISGANTETASTTVRVVAPVVPGNPRFAGGTPFINVIAGEPASNIVYFGGVFGSVAPMTGRAVMVNPTTGAVVDPYPQVVGAVRAIIPDGAGGSYMGGTIAFVNGTARGAVARIRADGTLDPTFSPVVVSTSTVPVLALALDAANGRLFIGGRFDSIADTGGAAVPSRGLMAVNASTGAALWTATAPIGAASHSVVSVALDATASSLYVGGSFSELRGVAISHLARVDAATGTVDGAWVPTPSAAVRSVLLDGARLYVGGDFNTIAGATRPRVARLDAASGANDVTFTPPLPDNVVTSLALDGPTLYVGGQFTSAGALARSGVAALLALDGSLVASFPDLNLSPSSVETLLVSGNTLYVAGAYRAIAGTTRRHLSAVDKTTGALLTTFDPGMNGIPTNLMSTGNGLLAGGDFTGAGESFRNNLAAVDVSTGELTSFSPDPNGAINALTVANGTLYAGGTFSNVAGVTPINRFAAVDTATGSAKSFAPDPNVGPLALVADGSTIYAGGSFTTFVGGAATRTRLAAVDTTGALLPLNIALSSQAAAVAVDASQLYFGGTFGTAGGQPRSRLAAVDKATGALSAFDPSPDGGVNALLVNGGNLYVGGSFSTIGGQSRGGLAALTPSGALLPFNGQTSSVSALAASGSTLYVVGGFNSLGGQPRTNVGALDLTTGLVTSFQAKPTSAPTTVVVSGETVIFGGSFEYVGDAPTRAIAFVGR